MSRFDTLADYPDFEIENDFPHTIRNIETKEEVVFKETSSGVVAKFDEKTKEYMHKIVAKQFLRYEVGPIKFDDGNKLNYDAYNLIVEKVKKKTSKPDKYVFTDNEYSYNEFREDLNQSKKLTLTQIKERLQKCVSVLPNGFAVKLRQENGVKYEVIKRSDMNNYFGFLAKFQTVIVTTDDVGNETEKTKVISKKCKKIIEDFEGDLIFFDGIRHVGFSERFLNMYRPPVGKYIKGLAERIIDFFEKRLHNPSALHELLSSHAYRFRHANTFIEKFFIHFSKESTTGKSLLAAILGTMYLYFANLAASPDQVESKFNGWMNI